MALKTNVNNVFSAPQLLKKFLVQNSDSGFAQALGAVKYHAKCIPVHQEVKTASVSSKVL
jgi:hypothetical protein